MSLIQFIITVFAPTYQDKFLSYLAIKMILILILDLLDHLLQSSTFSSKAAH